MFSGEAVGQRLRELRGDSSEQVCELGPEDVMEEEPEVAGLVLQP